MDPRALVTLPHGHGVAGVVRSSRRAALTHDATSSRGGTELAGYRPAVQGLEGEVTLTGGLLPPRAVRAVVLDRAGAAHEATCASGAWLALLDQPATGEAPIVRFLDLADDVVAVPLEAGVRVEAVSDAIDPCPACGALEWRKVMAAPPHRHGTDGAGRPTAARCGRCGHEEQLGVLYAAAAPASWPADEDVDDTGAEIAQRQAETRRAWIAGARSTPFRFYGLVDGSPVVAGLGHSNGAATSITLRYETAAGSVSIRTDAAAWLESPTWLARGALEGAALDDPWPDLSETAVLLWLNARAREREAEVHRAEVSGIVIAVDDEPITFMTASLHDTFAAAAGLRDATILVSGHGATDGLALRTVAAEELSDLR